MSPAETTNPGDPRASGHSLAASGGFVRSGKVRDLFEVGDRLLLVASDRLSAFDVVLPTPIPDKGRVLTGLSRFWFDQTADIIPNHLLGTDPGGLPAGFTDDAGRRELRGRMMLCRRAKVLPVEVIVRGYVSGSGWKDYRRTGAICGIRLPEGLRESDRLPAPIFTPSTKAEVGHDENIGFDAMVELVGGPLAEQVRDVALALYSRGAAIAEKAGILLADTKFELGTGARHRRADPDRRGHDARLQPLLGRRRRTSRGAPRPASTSNPSATGWKPSRGTRPIRDPSCRPRSWPGRASAMWRRSSGSPGPASSATCRRTRSPDERVPVCRQRAAQAGHPRPAGTSRGAQPARISTSPTYPGSGSGGGPS